MKQPISIALLCAMFFIGQHFTDQMKSDYVPAIKFSDINSVILDNYKMEQGCLDTACVNTVVILKFTYTTQGSIR